MVCNWRSTVWTRCVARSFWRPRAERPADPRDARRLRDGHPLSLDPRFGHTCGRDRSLTLAAHVGQCRRLVLYSRDRSVLGKSLSLVGHRHSLAGRDHAHWRAPVYRGLGHACGRRSSRAVRTHRPRATVAELELTELADGWAGRLQCTTLVNVSGA